MSLAVAMPKGVSDRKPAHGAQCNRCGVCCMASLCWLANAVFHKIYNPTEITPGPCPALEWDGKESRCGLMANPQKYRPEITDAAAPAYGEAVKYLVAAGTGCTARINGEPGDETFYAFLKKWDTENARHVRLAMKLWGIDPVKDL